MRLSLALVLAQLTLSVPVPEFVDLQRMPAAEIRARFDLAEDCDPRLTGLAEPPGRVVVMVRCQVRPSRTRHQPLASE